MVLCAYKLFPQDFFHNVQARSRAATSRRKPPPPALAREQVPPMWRSHEASSTAADQVGGA